MRSDLYDNTCALQVRMTAACPYPGYMGNLVCNGFLSVNCLNGCLTSSQVSSPTPGQTGKRVAGEPSQGDREQKKVRSPDGVQTAQARVQQFSRIVKKAFSRMNSRAQYNRYVVSITQKLLVFNVPASKFKSDKVTVIILQNTISDNSSKHKSDNSVNQCNELLCDIDT